MRTDSRPQFSVLLRFLGKHTDIRLPVFQAMPMTSQAISGRKNFLMDERILCKATLKPSTPKLPARSSFLTPYSQPSVAQLTQVSPELRAQTPTPGPAVVPVQPAAVPSQHEPAPRPLAGQTTALAMDDDSLPLPGFAPTFNASASGRPAAHDYEPVVDRMIWAACKEFEALVVGENAFPTAGVVSAWVRQCWANAGSKAGQQLKLTSRIGQIVSCNIDILSF